MFSIIFMKRYNLLVHGYLNVSFLIGVTVQDPVRRTGLIHFSLFRTVLQTYIFMLCSCNVFSRRGYTQGRKSCNKCLPPSRSFACPGTAARVSPSHGRSPSAHTWQRQQPTQTHAQAQRQADSTRTTNAWVGSRSVGGAPSPMHAIRVSGSCCSSTTVNLNLLCVCYPRVSGFLKFV